MPLSPTGIHHGIVIFRMVLNWVYRIDFWLVVDLTILKNISHQLG